MTIAIAGHSGFLGSILTEELMLRGHTVKGIPRTLLLNPTELSTLIGNTEVIINLSGASIGKRWTKSHKEEIYNSRINTTRCLVEAMSKLKTKPRLFVSASGVGIYDNIGIHSEESQGFANDFLANVCKDWENEASKAQRIGINTVILRMAPVLNKKNGILPKLKTLFGTGFGAILGSGQQLMPWISYIDWYNAMFHIIEQPYSKGVYNIVAPEIINNKKFSILLARSLQRPLFLKIPTFIIHFIFGENSCLVLEGKHVEPLRLIDEGFKFQCPNLSIYLKSDF